MEIAKNDRINSLFEFYEPLLTDKQKSYIEQYYGDDYSLGEIAENFSVSRQAVYDNIKRTEKILEGYETKLHLYADFLKRNQDADAIAVYVSTHYPTDKLLAQLVEHLELTDSEAE
ncbi:putative DNA-binding protein [Furfurilactobacillus sp. WILCCON 0119]|uniref:putative DNA-binding protein n=1 Tax=Furfurilactobacillus entadae TaxID=2922307 RepID=UPI0035EB9FDB